MPLPHVTPIFSVDNAAIYPLLTDVSPGPPTYGPAITLPGIRSATFEPDTLNKELFGDNAIIARAAKARQIMSKVGVAKMSLDVMAQLLGGTVTDTGVTPSQIATWSVLNSDAGKYFKLAYRVLGVELPGASGGGDMTVTYYKCKITDTGLATKMEDFAEHTFGVAAIALTSTGKIFDIAEHEVAVALPA